MNDADRSPDVRLIELTAIGPVPFAGALLADLGADVVRVDRIPAAGDGTRTAAALRLLQPQQALDRAGPEARDGGAAVLQMVATPTR